MVITGVLQGAVPSLGIAFPLRVISFTAPFFPKKTPR
jgi:hypothetical protein